VFEAGSRVLSVNNSLSAVTLTCATRRRSCTAARQGRTRGAACRLRQVAQRAHLRAERASGSCQSRQDPELRAECLIVCYLDKWTHARRGIIAATVSTRTSAGRPHHERNPSTDSTSSSWINDNWGLNISLACVCCDRKCSGSFCRGRTRGPYDRMPLAPDGSPQAPSGRLPLAHPTTWHEAQAPPCRPLTRSTYTRTNGHGNPHTTGSRSPRPPERATSVVSVRTSPTRIRRPSVPTPTSITCPPRQPQQPRGSDDIDLT